VTDPSYDTISQSAHFFSAAFVVHVFHGNLWAIGAVALLCILKEFVYDYLFESPAARGSSFKDFSWYFLGIVAGAYL
jgi:hypothetical protein